MKQDGQFHRILVNTFAESDPTYRLDDFIREARKEMGEAKWKRLNAEWEA